MITKIGTMFLMSASCVMLTLGCQQQAEEGAERKPLTKAEAAKYQELSINVTGMS